MDVTPDPSSPFWLASALGLNAAGNTGSNLTSLPPLVIHSSDYFTNPDYLKPKDKKVITATGSLLKIQSSANKVQEAVLQPVTQATTYFHGPIQHADDQLPLSYNADAQWNNHIGQSIDMSHRNSFSESQSALNFHSGAKDPKDLTATSSSPKMQSTTNKVQEAVLQPVTSHRPIQHADYQLPLSYNADAQWNNHIGQSIDMSHRNSFSESQSALNSQSGAKDQKVITATDSLSKMQSTTNKVQEAVLQPVIFHGPIQHVDYQLPLSYNADAQWNNHIGQSIDMSHRNSFSESQSALNSQSGAKDQKVITATNSLPKMQSTTNKVQEAVLQPVTQNITYFHGPLQHANYQLPLHYDANTQWNCHVEQSIDMSQRNSFSGSQSSLNIHSGSQNQLKDHQMQTSSTEGLFSRLPSDSTMSQNSSPSPLSVVGPPSQLDKSDKIERKRTRTKFEKWQLDALERQYAVTKNISLADRLRLEKQLNLSASHITIWFKNKRSRVKREYRERPSLIHYPSSIPLTNTVPNIQSSSQLQFNNQHVQFLSNVSSPQYYPPSTFSHQSSVSPQSSISSCSSVDFPTIVSGAQNPSIVDFEEWQLKAFNERQKGGYM